MLYRLTENDSHWRHISLAVGSALRGATGRLLRWVHGLDDVEHLRALDDWILADMGIERSEIADRVKGKSRPGER